MNDAERRRIAEAAQAASPSPWSLGLVGADEAQIPPHLAHIEASDPMAIIGLLDRIEALQADLAAVRETRPRWVPVGERLPETIGHVLVGYAGRSREGYWLREEKEWRDSNGFLITGATHWRELPAPPKGEP